MKNISVIVPVYNAEAYLGRCLDSILVQTYQDFELILVDDGSPDRCGAICDEYAQKDGRVRVIHKANGGVGAARNTGLDAATGEYIIFVDSDDYIHPEMLQILWDGIQTTGTQLCACGYFMTTGDAIPDNPERTAPRLWKPEAFWQCNELLSVVPWGKLYHRSCFEGVRYPPVFFADDEYVTYRILFSVDAIAAVETVLYAYFQNDAGITGSSWHPRRLGVFSALEQQVDFFETKGYRKLAADRVHAYEWNVSYQLEQALQYPDRKEKIRSVKECRKRLRFILRRYKHLVNYNLLDHRQLFERAAPAMTPCYRLIVWLWCVLSRLKKLITGK